MEKLVRWINEAPQSRIPILIAIIGLFGLIMGGMLTTLIWPWIKAGIEMIWDKIEKKFNKKKFEFTYLDWVVREHEFLPILPSTLVPVTKVNVQELDKLYVSLSIAIEGITPKNISLGEGLRENPALVIIGDPGAGKTTMLRFLALTFAQARRKRSSAKSLRYRQKDAEKIGAAQARVKAEFAFSDYPLPVFVYLNRLRDVTSWPASRSILDVLRDEWSAVDTLRDAPQNFFEDKLHRGECIFLLDAFDELGSQSARDLVANHIGRLASTAPQGNRFIVTSRIIGYSGQLAKYGFATLKVQRLSWDLIKELVTKWYDSLKEKQLANQLLTTLKTNERIAELAVNPMLLSLIVLVQYVKRIIPDRRHLLYDECVKILVERRYAPPDVQQSYNSVVPGEEAAYLVQEIAQHMHRHKLRELPRQELEVTIIPRILKQMFSGIASNVNSTDLLKNIEERSQLLVERGLNEEGKPVMAFSHLTFQEYLTSVAFKDLIGSKGEKRVSTDLINYYKDDSDWWEEVALLYAAQLNTQQRTEFFNRLYPTTAS